jgi:hypothetical protein
MYVLLNDVLHNGTELLQPWFLEGDLAETPRELGLRLRELLTHPHYLVDEVTELELDLCLLHR